MNDANKIRPPDGCTVSLMGIGNSPNVRDWGKYRWAFGPDGGVGFAGTYDDACKEASTYALGCEDRDDHWRTVVAERDATIESLREELKLMRYARDALAAALGR